MEADRQKGRERVAERKQRAADQTLKGVRATAKDGTGQNPPKTTFYALLHVRRGKKGADNSFDESPPVASLGAVSFTLPLKEHIRPTKHARGSRRTLHVADIVNRFFVAA